MKTQIDFSKKNCLPCEGLGRVMTREEIVENLNSIAGWTLAVDDKSIERRYTFKNFIQAVDMVNLIKNVAEDERHHPDLHITGYKNLKVVLYTHALGGLTQNDFIVAAKINKIG